MSSAQSTAAQAISLADVLRSFDGAGFLSRLGVMDYSLLVGVDRQRQELVVGLIDYIRQVSQPKQASGRAWPASPRQRLLGCSCLAAARCARAANAVSGLLLRPGGACLTPLFPPANCLQYTWDKQVETWVKKSGLLGGAGKDPTVISPRQYSRRFRAAMASYLTLVPGLQQPPASLDLDAQ